MGRLPPSEEMYKSAVYIYICVHIIERFVKLPLIDLCITTGREESGRFCKDLDGSGRVLKDSEGY